MTRVPVAEREICQLTTEIWNSVLGMEINETNDPPSPDESGCLTGCVQITGAWEGAVTIDFGTQYAREATSLMLGMDADGLEMADVQDAIGELANILGGNVKALLPSPCEISLPSVTEGRDYRLRVPGSQLACHVAFECQGNPVHVSLFQREAVN